MDENSIDEATSSSGQTIAYHSKTTFAMDHANDDYGNLRISAEKEDGRSSSSLFIDALPIKTETVTWETFEIGEGVYTGIMHKEAYSFEYFSEVTIDIPEYDETWERVSS